MAQGVVVTWDGKRGFGFVRSADYPDDVFVHATAVAGRVPLSAGQRVEFAAEPGERGLRAVRVVPGRRGLSPALAAAALMVAVLAVLAAGLHRLGLGWTPAVLGGIWVVTWFTYARDKRRAGLGERRIPESVLLGLALVGGSPAAALAMAVLRHKTRKPSFRLKFAAVVALQIALVATAFALRVQ